MNASNSNIMRPTLAAIYLGISQASLRRLAQNGQIKKVALGKRAIGFLKTELDNFIERRSA